MDAAAVPALETLLVAGEACPPELIETWARGRRLVNAYGPTETTVTATFARVRPGMKKPPIGRPMANFQVYVLDASMRPAPIGAAGELYIGGLGLARGYLNRPELTAERFVPDPFSREPGARLYRTGDRVRYLGDASLDFLGRADDQVKIRGFRIELGEVEAAIARHASVRECAVVVDAGAALGDKRLVAFVVGEGQAPTHAELRAHAKGALPAHMVPASFVVLDALPLTPNAKIDRKALAARAKVADDDGARVAPRTPAEETVASIWAEVLRVDRPSIVSDFFALGGHSLSAVRVAMKLEERFHVAVPLRLVFERPTIEALAEELAARRGARLAAPSIDAGQARDRYPLTFAQEQVWLVDGVMPGHPAYDHPIALRLRGPLQLDLLRRAIDAIVERHAPLRTTFARVDDAPVQIVAPRLVVEPTLLDLGSLAPDEREPEARMLAREQARHAFDLARGPLLRVTVIRLDDRDHVLVLNLHHIVSDAWSMALLLDELGALYRAFVAGAPSPLAPLPISYGDFALHQRALAAGGGLRDALARRVRELEGAPTRLDLPFDEPRPAVASFRGATVRLALDHDTTSALRAVARAEAATTFAALAAAFAVAIARFTERDDLLLGVPNAGRTTKEVERLIGMFTNILVLRADLRGAATFRELVRRTREALLAAHDARDVPFERLVEVMAPRRSLAHNPLVQVAIVPQDVPFEGLALGDVAASPMELDRDVAQFDLVAFTREEPGAITGWIEHSTDTLAPDTARAMVAAMVRLAGELACSPDAPLDRAVLRPDERAWVAARLAALREPERAADRAPRSRLPAGPIEAAIARAFAEELACPHVQVDDDFFELGGHSLKAARVVARLERELGVTIGLRRFFEGPSVASLAWLVESAEALRDHAPMTAIAPATVRRSTYLSFGQHALFRLDRERPGLAYHIPLAFHLRGPLDPRAVESALLAIVDRHEPLRATFRLGADSHLLAVVLHHIVADGWSLGLLLRELEALFAEASCAERQPSRAPDDDEIEVAWDVEGDAAVDRGDASRDLASLARRYADFAAWERRWVRPEVLEPALDFWRGYLAGAPAALELVTDRPRPALPSYAGAAESSVLDLELTAGLRAHAASRRASPFMLSLALFGLVLRAWSGADDLVVGAASSGRPQRDLEPLIGCFFNKLALRLRPRGALAWETYLAETRASTLAAFERKDAPFELVARALAPSPPAGRTPLFQVAYAHQEAGWEELRLPQVTSQPVFLDRGMAPLDLTLYTRDTPAGLHVWLERDTALFDAATARRMLERFEPLARAVVTSPSATLDALAGH
jgi:non-ribosomal peptide synthetase component F